ncbi:hypothetical protein T492DRAFT_891421 [Pavlovales sp. CCMP2436]|nr:hypothetical protein T492DRAFT_891421 [Pavlovales sp. CCMP2436]
MSYYTLMAFCGREIPVEVPTEGLSVGIIGAGVAGLQQARALHARGVKVTIFERAPTVGGVWRSNYSNFNVQLYEFLDFPYKKSSACSDLCNQEYPAGPEVQAYIERYVEHFSLHAALSLDTAVVNVAPTGKGEGWTFTLESKGKKYTQSFDYCVVATGMYNSTPNMPEMAGAAEFVEAGGQILHSTVLTDASMVKDKRVLVIGGGKSAIDCTMEAAKKRSTMLFRESHWAAPRLLAWFIPFQYVFLSRFGQLLVSLRKGPFPIGAPNWLTYAHALLACVMYPVFRIVEELVALQV